MVSGTKEKDLEIAIEKALTGTWRENMENKLGEPKADCSTELRKSGKSNAGSRLYLWQPGGHEPSELGRRGNRLRSRR